MEDLKTIWRRPAYLPYVQPPLTDKMVTDAEKQLDRKLPLKLIELLKIQNGGYLRKLLKDDSCPSTMIMGIGPHRPSLTSLDWDQKDLLPFDGDSHWNLCLDYRANKEEPCITLLGEGGEEKKIANTFKAKN